MHFTLGSPFQIQDEKKCIAISFIIIIMIIIYSVKFTVYYAL